MWTHNPQCNLVYGSTNDDLQDLIIPVSGNSFVAGRPDLQTRDAHMIYVPLSKVAAMGEGT